MCPKRPALLALRIGVVEFPSEFARLPEADQAAGPGTPGSEQSHCTQPRAYEDQPPGALWATVTPPLEA
eukprot:2980415-Amphidinium_carterae.1